MDVFQKLTIFTCITSTVTLALVCTAMLPHLRHGFTLVRDAVLWASFVLVVCGLLWIGISRLTGREIRIGGSAPDAESNTTVLPVFSVRQDADPYYRGNYRD